MVSDIQKVTYRTSPSVLGGVPLPSSLRPTEDYHGLREHHQGSCSFAFRFQLCALGQVTCPLWNVFLPGKNELALLSSSAPGTTDKPPLYPRGKSWRDSNSGRMTERETSGSCSLLLELLGESLPADKTNTPSRGGLLVNVCVLSAAAAAAAVLLLAQRRPDRLQRP